jgi:hypothetical protein
MEVCFQPQVNKDALTTPEPAFAEQDRDEQRGDPKELAEPAALDRRTHDHEEEKERQHSRGGRHERGASGQADGGSGSGDAKSSFVPRMRRIAHASGS